MRIYLELFFFFSELGNKCNGDSDQLHILQTTIPVDDTDMCEYEFATQVMDPDGETQAVNFDGETQAVNFDGETEAVTLDEETQAVNVDTEYAEMDILDETQLVDDYDTEEVVVSDHEGSGHTEIVEDSDEDSCRRECTRNIHQCEVDVKENEPKIDCGRNEQHTSGSCEILKWRGGLVGGSCCNRSFLGWTHH